MVDELNPQDSSQVVESASAEATPNAVEKPSEPVAQSMTPSQQADYYNKTQQHAQERRQFEQERRQFEETKAKFEQERQSLQRPPDTHQGRSPDTHWTPTQPPQVDQATYAKLVEQFGQEGADLQVRLIQQSTAPVQQELAQAKAEIAQAKYTQILSSLNSKGANLYGEEWKVSGAEVIDLVKSTGLPLERAWYAVRGQSIEQAAIDKAYQAQQQKAAGNVAQPGIQASGAEAEYDSFDAAFQAAKQRHS